MFFAVAFLSRRLSQHFQVCFLVLELEETKWNLEIARLSPLSSTPLPSCDESASDVSTLIMNTSAPDALGLPGTSSASVMGGGTSASAAAVQQQLGLPASSHHIHHIHPTSNPSSPFSGRRGDKLRAGDHAAAKPLVANLSKIITTPSPSTPHSRMTSPSHHHRLTSPARRPGQVAVGAPPNHESTSKG